MVEVDEIRTGQKMTSSLKKVSSAQITQQYAPEELVGKQVLAVVNFPPRQIANFFSQVLVLGTYSQGGVVLITPDKPVENGDRLG